MVAQPIIHAIAPGKAFEDRKAIAGKCGWLDGTVARKNIRTDVMVSLIAGNIIGYHRILQQSVSGYSGKQPQSRTFEEGKAFLKEIIKCRTGFYRSRLLILMSRFFLTNGLKNCWMTISGTGV